MPNNNVNTIVIDGKGTKWIGTDGGLVNIDGMNWTLYTTSNSSLPDKEVNSIVIEENGNRWIGTAYGGVLTYYQGKIVSVENYTDTRYQIPDKYLLYQNYPNPFNPSTKIRFRISNSGFVSIKVYDILGREVTTLVNDEKPAGIYEVSFDASELSSGVYFYKLRTGNYIQTKKMVLLR